MIALVALAGCLPSEVAIGTFDVSFERDGATLSIARGGVDVLKLDGIEVGNGDADITHAFGSYLFENVEAERTSAEQFRVHDLFEGWRLMLRARDEAGEDLAMLDLFVLDDDVLAIEIDSLRDHDDRVRATFGCTGNDVFLGGGSHAFDVDHGGEAFGLWVSEPGVGKVATDDAPADWALTGTRHASSHPSPFFLRPEEPVGVAAETWARVEVDLCASEPDSWSIEGWSDALPLVVFGGDTPLEVMERQVAFSGLPDVPPDWAFAPWNDAVRGPDRVREVALELREAGAPSSVIWTEDWRGGEELASGLGSSQYHPSREWDLDEELYVDAEGLDAELEAAGFKWLAYFAPFLVEGTDTTDEAAEHAIRDESGDTYWFTGFTLEQTTVLDVTDDDARDWAKEKMDAALDAGFDGWMADFGEWLPPDAVLSDADALDDHNAYPYLWHTLSAEATSGRDAAYFVRSGWLGTQAVAPVTWLGDQRTSFDPDDGLPSVVPLALGAAIGGVAFIGHDIAGYQSIGNDTSDRELWYRWCALGAFSPIMRTHHGADDQGNWQFDTDDETLALYARYGAEHARLFPYLRGLAEQARTRGTPLILPPAMVYDTEWDRIDAWLLGRALLVAPVTEAGAGGRDVDLPPGVRWHDWWTGDPVLSGWVDAEADEIPVFAASGTVVPTLGWAPDTFADATDDGVTTLEDADQERIVRVFGTGGTFEEADGTTYAVSGTALDGGSATDTFASGSIEVNGLTVEISGEAERTYTVVAVP